MKYLPLMTIAFLCLASCTSVVPTTDHGGATADTAADGSPSPLSRSQALALAKPLVQAREHWLEETPNGSGSYHLVSYAARRLDQGPWRVIAKSLVQDTWPPGGEALGYNREVPAVVLVISRRGKVVSYAHSTDPDFDYPPPA